MPPRRPAHHGHSQNPFDLPPSPAPLEPVSPMKTPSPRGATTFVPGLPSGPQRHPFDDQPSPTHFISQAYRRLIGRSPQREGTKMLHPVPPPEERARIAAERRAKKRADVNNLPVDALDHQDQPAEGFPVQSVPDSAPDLNRPLHPFEKPDESRIHNLLDLVWAALPPVPDIYDQSKLSGTRKPTKSFDLALPGDEQLKYIVFCKDMLSPVEGDVAALLKDIAIDWDNDAHRTFVARVFPWMRAMDNAKQINSEVDTEDWINSVLVRPAIAVLHAIILGHIPEDVDPRYPFSCSSHNKHSTRPDFLIILRGRHPRESIAGCGEYKTHKIIAEGDNPLWLVQRPIPDHPTGAYKFNWPSTSWARKGDKILVQIWSQLKDWGASWGVLSSMELTSFYATQPNEPNTLYISETQGPDDPTLFRMVCWLMLATKSKGVSLDLPAPDIKWWNLETKRDTTSGVSGSPARRTRAAR